MLSSINCFVQTSAVEPTVVWLLFQSQKSGLNSKFDAYVTFVLQINHTVCILTVSQHLFYAF